MSQQTATARTTQRSGSPARRPARSFQVVSAAPPQRGQSAFVALCTLLLFGGLVAVLLLNTVMAKGSFELDHLQARVSALADTQESLAHDVDAQSAPAELARRALALGMVPSASAAFLRLSDGRILGHATPATRADGFSVATGTAGPTATASAPAKTTATPATKKSATKKQATTKPATKKPATTTTPGQGG